MGSEQKAQAVGTAPYTDPVTLGTSVYPPETQFPHLQNGHVGEDMARFEELGALGIKGQVG